MPAKNETLHGNAPDTSSVALLLIDVISDFSFQDGDLLLQNFKPAAQNIARLAKKARAGKVPVIYVNDNFGKWQSDFKKLLDHCQSKSSAGRTIAKMLSPKKDDYFVLKPKHSAFYSTSLDILLDYLKVKTLILTGIAADVCVLFTANDAHMRDLNLIVPQDCVASVKSSDAEYTLAYLQRLMKVDTRPSDEVDFRTLLD
jgi:nicotinamidase-related amidase